MISYVSMDLHKGMKSTKYGKYDSKYSRKSRRREM